MGNKRQCNLLSDQLLDGSSFSLIDYYHRCLTDDIRHRKVAHTGQVGLQAGEPETANLES